MPVEDVWKPQSVKTVDPRTAGEKDSESVDYWERKKREARSRLEYEEAQSALQRLGAPAAAESPFKVTGEVNLGKFDLQDQQNRTQQAMDKMQKEKDDELRSERSKNETLAEELQRERADALRRDFDTRFEQLTKTIQDLTTARQRDERPLMEQFREQYGVLQELAKDMGLERTAGGQDPQLTLQLAELQYKQAREDREFKRQMRNDDKRWQLEIKRMDAEQEARHAELQQQARRNDMIASAPAWLGNALGQAVRSSAEEQLAQQAPGVNQAKAYQVKIPPMQGANLPCPNCGNEVAFGADTTLGRCIACGSQFRVLREAPPGQDMPPPPDENEE